MPADAPRRRPGMGGAHGSAEHAGAEREQSLHRGAFRRRAVTDREASTAMRDDRRDPMAPRDTLNARLTAVFLALAVAIPVLGGALVLAQRGAGLVGSPSGRGLSGCADTGDRGDRLPFPGLLPRRDVADQTGHVARLAQVDRQVVREGGAVPEAP